MEPGVSLALAQERATLIADLHYGLNLSIPRKQEAAISGSIAIDFTLAGKLPTPLLIDFREDPARIRSARVNGVAAEIAFSKEHLLVEPQLLRRGHNTVEFEFVAGPGSLNRNPDFLYTLFVPDRARTAFPVFDQPDLKASWDLSLEIPDDWTAISAAPVIRTETKGDRQTLDFARSDLMSTYLFSFVAGNFEAIVGDAGGRELTLLHRETDAEKVARNTAEIFQLHDAALRWLEAYTGIDYPFQKLDIALLPSHPYGGMEHVGAIQYRAESLWLDEGAPDTQRMRRATLIAHEVAHMWFGNLVTMRWFDDVWTKEVFANFMAAKIANPYFPNIDHELGFLLDHHPGAYSVDRTAGANAIRQPLANLNQAGQLYGAIIYDKAPIMMRQLEQLVGEAAFQKGMREYLTSFANANASWPELIAILDKLSDEDLAAWSQVWVNTPGRPVFSVEGNDDGLSLRQSDPVGRGRRWPQQFQVSGLTREGKVTSTVDARNTITALAPTLPADPASLLFSARGYGYGLFPADMRALDTWRQLDSLSLASLLINLKEQMLETGTPAPGDYLENLLEMAPFVDDQLLLNRVLNQLRTIYWTLIDETLRVSQAPALENLLWEALSNSESESVRKLYFMALADVTLTEDGLTRLADIWSGEQVLVNLPLSERDLIHLCGLLAIKNPDQADRYIAQQLARTENLDQRRRLEFLRPSLSADSNVRDEFFRSLAHASNRETESWVIDGLENLHHPLRVHHSADYILPSLNLLEEIQTTGDIFFPTGWLQATLRYHHSDRAVNTVTSFLDRHPDYNPQLRMKIQQSADPLLRSNRLRKP